MDVLKKRIRFLATTSGTHDPVVRQRTVLRCYGIDDPEKLLPAPAHFDPVVRPLSRVQDTQLADAIGAAKGPMLITAPGGVGKSVMAQRIDLLLPPGSEAVVFDGFAGGRYRSPSEVRHRHDVGLVHIVNTLDGQCLCDILLPPM